jgi:hypothetical protein
MLRRENENLHTTIRILESEKQEPQKHVENAQDILNQVLNTSSEEPKHVIEGLEKQLEISPNQMQEPEGIIAREMSMRDGHEQEEETPIPAHNKHITAEYAHENDAESASMPPPPPLQQDSYWSRNLPLRPNPTEQSLRSELIQLQEVSDRHWKKLQQCETERQKLETWNRKLNAESMKLGGEEHTLRRKVPALSRAVKGE